MTKMRLLTFITGGAMIVACFIIPAAAPALLPTGTGLLGLATKWPGDKPADPACPPKP